jgi:Protein of unknown function (DUF3047)
VRREGLRGWAFALVGLAAAAAIANAGEALFDLPLGPVVNETQGWRPQAISRVPLPQFIVEEESGAKVVRARASAGVAGTLVQTFPPRLPGRLSWRWQVSSANLSADVTRRESEDAAARIYVSFDVPLATLSFADRSRIRLARLVFGPQVPTAALCYIWDGKHPVGSIIASPYSNRVRMVVLQSGNANSGQWQREDRDLAADFLAAFGGPAPKVTGIAFGLDTDQTRVESQAAFADMVWAGDGQNNQVKEKR